MYEFKPDQPLLDLYEGDARRPRIWRLNKRTRAFLNLFCAVGSNQHFEVLIFDYLSFHYLNPCCSHGYRPELTLPWCVTEKANVRSGQPQKLSIRLLGVPGR